MINHEQYLVHQSRVSLPAVWTTSIHTVLTLVNSDSCGSACPPFGLVLWARLTAYQPFLPPGLLKLLIFRKLIYVTGFRQKSNCDWGCSWGNCVHNLTYPRYKQGTLSAGGQTRQWLRGQYWSAVCRVHLWWINIWFCAAPLCTSAEGVAGCNHLLKSRHTFG